MTETQTIERLKKKEQLLEKISESIGAGIVLISKDFKTLWANEVIKSIFGEVEGKPCHSTFNKQEQVCPGCGVKKIFETGAKSVTHEQKGFDAEGNLLWSQIIATPLYDTHGNIESALEVVMPITVRKIAEEELIREKNFSDSLINSLPGIMYLLNGNGNFLRWNKNLEKVTGYSPSEIVEMTIPDLIAPDDKEHFENFVRSIAKEGTGPSVIAGLSTKSGAVVPHSFTATRFFDDNLRYQVGIALDISEQIAHEKEKNTLINELQTALAQVKQLSGMLPICASCKKIRDDHGYWTQIESYLKKHSTAEFSHGICPDCMKRLYPDVPEK